MSKEASAQYQDDDLVYVDPEQKRVVGLVEWKNDKPVPKEVVLPEPEDGKPRKQGKTRYYPWGTYRTMKAMYKLEGKVKDKETDDYISLNDAIDKLQQDPYWN